MIEQPIEVCAPAKVNLALHVGPRRPDGNHQICSLMEKVGLFDTLLIRLLPAGSGFSLTGDVPAGEDNTVARIARALAAETGTDLSMEIELQKEIPAGAGLGGGSSDAAAAMMALVRLYGLDLVPQRLVEIAAGVGADVPFFLPGGAQLAEGAGELLTPVGPLPEHSLVLAVPESRLSTARVYGRFDESAAASTTGFDECCRHLKQKVKEMVRGPAGLETLSGILHNDLEPPALSLAPEIARIRNELSAAGARACLMSGSGSAVFGLFDAGERAEAAAVTLQQSGLRVWAVQPVNSPA